MLGVHEVFQVPTLLQEDAAQDDPLVDGQNAAGKNVDPEDGREPDRVGRHQPVEAPSIYTTSKPTSMVCEIFIRTMPFDPTTTWHSTLPTISRCTAPFVGGGPSHSSG